MLDMINQTGEVSVDSDERIGRKRELRSNRGAVSMLEIPNKLRINEKIESYYLSFSPDETHSKYDVA